MRSIKLSDLIHRILLKHTDPNTKTPELILLGYCSNKTAGEHIARYQLASKLVYGVVLDVASGTCYGSSILKRASDVKMVVSVDIDKDVLKYGRMVYNADCVCADALHLPFKEKCFDSIVSLETLEHLKDQKAFLENAKTVLKKGGKFILSTPNKMYTSPFLPNPLNPYHVNEFYLGALINLLETLGFKIEHIYGDKIKKLELLRRVFGSLIKFCMSKIFLEPYLLDKIYQAVKSTIYRLYCRKIIGENHLIDPTPNIVIHQEVKTTSNIIFSRYFLVCISA